MLYNPKTKTELMALIDSHEAISFDIWDTIITRKVLRPEDVFEIVESKSDFAGFANIRNQIISESNIANPNIYELYGQLQERLSLSDDRRKELLNLEIEIEKSVITPRKDMVDILSYAISMGKKVSLITDMYLPKEIMSMLLDSLDIKGYERLYVSCEYRQLKCEKLFDIYKKEVVAQSYLHIGDNPESDGNAAVTHNIDAANIMSGYELIRQSVYAPLLLEISNRDDRLMSGFFVAKAFNSPFISFNDRRGIDIEDLYSISYLFFAPLVTYFMKWLIKNVSNDSFDMVLFSARDGFILNDLYNMSKESGVNLPEAAYILASRQLCTLAAINEDSDIEWLSLVNFNGTPQELLSERFCLCEDEISVFDEDEFLSVKDYVMAHKEAIYRKAEVVRTGYDRHLKEFGINSKGRYAFYDFVSSGTCQYFLTKWLTCDLCGKYFCYSPASDKKDSIDVDALFMNNGVEQSDSYFYSHYKLMETLMTSTMSSVRAFDVDGKPVYNKEIRTNNELEYVVTMQQAIKDYYRDFIKLSTSLMSVDGRKVPEKLFQYMDRLYTDINCDAFTGIELVDDWVGEKLSDVALTDNVLENAIYSVNDNDYSNVLANTNSWEVFGNLSTMRTSIIGWYDFKEHSRILEINAGYGAITECLCNRCESIVCVTGNEYRTRLMKKRFEKRDNIKIYSTIDVVDKSAFDYIIIEGIFQADYSYLKDFIGPETNLLIMADNSNGTRYQAGYPGPDPIDLYDDGRELCINKEDLADLVRHLGFTNMKFYYPFPDYKLAQEIFTDEYMPHGSIRDRVLFYYVKPGMVNADEYELCDDAIRSNCLANVANSYLVEAAFNDNMSKAKYVALSTDRGAEHGFATIIEKTKVIKKAIDIRAIPNLRACHDNIMDIASRGNHIVGHEFINNEIIMPIAEGTKAVDWLYQCAVSSKDDFLCALDKLYNCIVPKYVDMIPLNAFVKDKEYYFFDQEFLDEESDKDYVMFRAIRYLYLSYPELDKVVSQSTVISRYNLEDRWKEFLVKEDRFIYNIRQHRINHSFYEWLGNGYNMKGRGTFDNGIKLVSGFDYVESDGSNTWSWALTLENRFVIENTSGKACNVEFTCYIAPPPGLDKQSILFYNEKQYAPCNIRKVFHIDAGAREMIMISVLGKLTMADNGDPRKFGFQMINPHIEYLEV